MKPHVSRLSLAAIIILCLSAIAVPGRAQTESKVFGKLLEGENSITIKANRTAKLTGGARTWKRQMEIIVFRPYETQNYYSDEHYSDTDIASLHKALGAVKAQYQQWKGKRLGTQSKGIEVRRANDAAGIVSVTIALQMDEAGKISLAFAQGEVGIETTPANLAKFSALTNNAIAWLASPAGAAVGKKKAAK